MEGSPGGKVRYRAGLGFIKSRLFPATERVLGGQMVRSRDFCENLIRLSVCQFFIFKAPGVCQVFIFKAPGSSPLQDQCVSIASV